MGCLWNVIPNLQKQKQPLIVELDFAQRYKIGIDWDAYGTLILRYKTMKKGNQCQQIIAFLETSVAEKWARDQWKCLVTHNAITVLPYHVSFILLKPVASRTHGL